MKLAFINGDESWFWVLDETGHQWQCWYEIGDEPAIRLEKMDRWLLEGVLTLVEEMSLVITPA